mmetsp:Transcript_33105/g.75590  ORF Transcript_33105/g.75590 Transcript_33105/m.75590 type:complete len:240 (-) Transcript_33105:497-1216(-)
MMQVFLRASGSRSEGNATVQSQLNTHFWRDGMNASTKGKRLPFMDRPQRRDRGLSSSFERKVSSLPNTKGNLRCHSRCSAVHHAIAIKYSPSPRLKPRTTFFTWSDALSPSLSTSTDCLWGADSLLWAKTFLLVMLTRVCCIAWSKLPVNMTNSVPSFFVKSLTSFSPEESPSKSFIATCLRRASIEPSESLISSSMATNSLTKFVGMFFSSIFSTVSRVLLERLSAPSRIRLLGTCVW